MHTFLIVDSVKSSVVMSSEVFKEKVPGCHIKLAGTGEQCLEMVKEQKFKMILIDFDLPDTDAINLTKGLREVYEGPILITAFPEALINEAIEKELFGYQDSSNWLRKPLRSTDLKEKIDYFFFQKKGTRKVFATEFDVTLIGKGEGRGKRAPKLKGNLVNITLDKAMVNCTEPISFEKGQEITIKIDYSTISKNVKAKSKSKRNMINPPNIKAVISSMNKRDKKILISFGKLSEVSKNTLHQVMKSGKELKITDEVHF